MEQYCIYLRKSRTDAEAELRGEGETLARHEQALLELARYYKLNITAIYREIVSGDSIAARPIMQQMLEEIESGLWSGCLVMEIERLARGDTIDQGIVSQTFKFSSTKIITPTKIYDPNNEFDQEYFEFKLFMSRREYQTINERLQRGRLASVKEGKYIGNRSPYGYKRVKIPNDKGFTLEIVPEEAEIVKMIFQWSINGIEKEDKNGNVSLIPAGTWAIAKELNRRGLPSPQKNKVYEWRPEVVREILINPVYCGYLLHNSRKEIKKIVNGKVIKTRPRNLEATRYKGLHPAIISEELAELAEQKNCRKVANRSNFDLKNPLAGLVYCSRCGHSLIYRAYYQNKKEEAYRANIRCRLLGCKTVSSYLNIVEEHVLLFLEKWLNEYKLELKNNESKSQTSTIKGMKATLSKTEKEINSLEAQLERTYDLLEKEIYSVEIFLERSKVLNKKIENLRINLSSIKNIIHEDQMKKEARGKIIPQVETVLSTYYLMPNPAAKNELLRTVIEKIVYTKDTQGIDKFKLDIYPKISNLS